MLSKTIKMLPVLFPASIVVVLGIMMPLAARAVLLGVPVTGSGPEGLALPLAVSGSGPLGLALPLAVSGSGPLGLALPLSIQGAPPGPQNLSIKTAGEPVTQPETFGSTPWILRYVVNPIARGFARAALTALTQQVVNWVSANGGNNVGFVGNFEKTLTNELDNAAGEFLDQIPYIDFCGDIGAYLKLNLRLPAGGLRQRARCSLSAIVSNVQHFYDNFQNGGWEAFLKTNVDIQNNTAGAFLIALDEKIGIESRKKDAFVLRYQKSSIGGLLNITQSETHCVPRPDLCNNDPQAGPVGCFPQPEQCLTETVEKTPGTIIEQTIKDANKTGIDFGISAKEFDEAIGAIMTALLQRTISSAGGIFGQSPPGQPNYGDPLYTYQELGPSQDSLRKHIEAGIFLAYGTKQAIDTSMLALRQELAAVPPPSAAREAEIKRKTADLLSKRQTVAAIENQVVTTKQSSFNAISQSDIAAIDTRVTQSMDQLDPIASSTGASPYASPTGDMKTDALNDLSGARTHLASETNLVNQAINEINTILASTTVSISTNSSTTLQNYRDLLTNTATSPGGVLQQFQNTDAKLQNEYATIQKFVTSSEAIGETGNAIGIILAANDTQQNATAIVRNAFGFLDSIVGSVLTSLTSPSTATSASSPIPPPI